MSVARARQLRRAMTDAERRLWRALRNRGLGNFKFRRQAPIGPFIADFICHEARLIVEVDGGHHGEEAQMKTDAERTLWLETKGYRIIRVQNSDVLNNLDGVLEYLLTQLQRSE